MRFLRQKQPVERVFIEVTAAREEIETVERVFSDAGLHVAVDPELPLSGGPRLPVEWALQITLAVPIATFFATLARKAGEDAYSAFAAFVRQLVSKRGQRGQITLWDKRAEIWVAVPVPPSEEAMAALRDVDWKSARG